MQATYDADGKIVFVSSKADRMEDERKKMWKNDKPEDAVDKYEDEEPVSRPNGTERAEVEKIMAKKQRGEYVLHIKTSGGSPNRTIGSLQQADLLVNLLGPPAGRV